MPGTALTTLLAVATSVAIAGCGEEGTIPEGDAADLLGRLDAVETNVNAGDCLLAQDQAGEFSDTVAQLPAEVDGEVREGLEQSAERLVQLTGDEEECQGVETGATGDGGVVPSTDEPPPPPPPPAEEETTDPEGDDEGDDSSPPPAEEEPAEEQPADEGETEPPTGGGEVGGSGGGVGTGGVSGGGGDG